MPIITQRKVKGLQAFALRDKTTLPGTLLVLPTPTGAAIDPGITQILGSTKSDLGETVTESVEIDEQNPLINVTFPFLTPAALSVRLLKQLETETGAPFYSHKRLRVTKNAYDGAATGNVGNGMPADQVGSLASVIGPLGESVPLTRLTYAGFDPVGTTDSFAQGDDGAQAWSDNLIGSDVVYSFPNTQDGLAVGENPIIEMDLTMTVAMSDLKLFQVRVPGVLTDLEASGDIPLGAGEMSMVFRSIYNGESCVPIEYRFIGQAIAC